MFGLDMGMGDDDMVGIQGPAVPVGPLDAPAYLGVPPPAYSDLSSRRTQQQAAGGSSNEQSTVEEGNNTSGGERTNEQAPQSNPASDNNTPASTVRSQDSTARSRPRPLHRPPPSEVSVDSMATSTARGAGSLVYMNFDLESEDGCSTTSRPTTLLRDEAVARIMVSDTINESNTESTELQNQTVGTQSNTGSDAQNRRSPESRSRQGQSPSETGSRSSEESRARSRRVREGVTRDGSKNRSNAESRANNNRPERPSERDNVRSSSARPTTPVPDYTLEQSSRNRRIHQDATELPPPYQTLDPNRRPSRDELEAQAFAQVHAQAHADARAEYMMRQRSRNRDYDPGWFPDMHGFDGVQEHPPMMGPGPGPMMGPGMVDPYYQVGAFP